MASFTEGQRILIGQFEYTLDRFFQPGRIWQIRSGATGDCTKRPLSDLLELYRTKQLTLISAQPDACDASAKMGKELQPQRDQYRPAQQVRATRYEAYLKAMDESGVSRDNRHLEKLIAVVAIEISDPKPPTLRTLRQARKRWIACDRDFRSQIMQFDKCGNRNRFSPAMEWLILRGLEGFLSKSKTKITICWQDLDAKIIAINSLSDDNIRERFSPEERESLELQQLKNEVPLTTPERSALYRRVHNMPEYDILVSRYGKDYTDRVYRTTFPGEKSPRRLGKIDGDETTTDIFCIDEIRGLWLGRCYATVLYEDFCHGVNGFYLGFEPHSVLAHFRAIRHSILPKTYITTEYPTIKNTWDLYGVGDIYHFDNAMAVHSKDLEAAMKDLRASILYDLPARPWFKGLIERWFRELNTQFLHNLPGTTFSRFADLDGDYDPQKNAVIPYGLLLLLFHKFVVDIHLQSWNRGISDTPAHRWASFVDELPPPVPPTASELDIILGRRLERKIFHYGIEIDYLRYQSRELGELRRRLARPGMEHPVVDVNAPPGDIGYIHVFDPERKMHTRVPAVEQEYASGLSMHAHGVHLRYTRKYKDGRVDVHALSEAQADIWSMCLEATKLNKQVARYMEDHARQNPVGPLAAHEMVTKVLDRISGKKPASESLATLTGPNKQLKRNRRRASEQPLPCFETDDLPELSANGANGSSTPARRELK